MREWEIKQRRSLRKRRDEGLIEMKERKIKESEGKRKTDETTMIVR